MGISEAELYINSIYSMKKSNSLFLLYKYEYKILGINRMTIITRYYINEFHLTSLHGTLKKINYLQNDFRTLIFKKALISYLSRLDY